MLTVNALHFMPSPLTTTFRQRAFHYRVIDVCLSSVTALEIPEDSNARYGVQLANLE